MQQPHQLELVGDDSNDTQCRQGVRGEEPGRLSRWDHGSRGLDPRRQYSCEHTVGNPDRALETPGGHRFADQVGQCLLPTEVPCRPRAGTAHNPGRTTSTRGQNDSTTDATCSKHRAWT